MAIEGKYAKQMAFVGTEAQYVLLKKEADRHKTSIAAVLRAAIDVRYGLVDGEQPVKK